MTPSMLMRSLRLSAVLTVFTAIPAAAEPVRIVIGDQGMIWIGVVMLVGFIAFGVYMIYAGIKSRAVAKASETWPTAGGTVLASEVTERKHHNRKKRTTTYYYEPVIRYNYKIAGTDYESSPIRFGDLVRNTRSLSDELVAKYPQGSTVAVRYDPNDPARATLETSSAGGRQVFMGAVFVAVSLFIGVIMAILGSGPSLLSPEELEQLNQTPQTQQP